MAKELVQHAKAGSCYRIYLEEFYQNYFTISLLAIRKRPWFQHDGLPSTVVRLYLDAIVGVRWIGVGIYVTNGGS